MTGWICRCQSLAALGRKGLRLTIMTAGLALVMSCAASAQEPEKAAPAGEQAQGQELAKQLANPVADLVSVPFQFNWAQGVGPNEETRFILNVQPVMPFSITKDVNLIVRVIAPFVGQPVLFEGGAPATGLGDLLTSFFFSPSRSRRLIWGVGPVFSLPSTSEPTLGSGKWSAGPTAVVLRQSGPWTVGALWNQVWSFAGSQNRADVSQMFLQPFLAYTTKTAVTFVIYSESTANWEAEQDQWTVPINFAVSKLSSFGVFPASYQLGFGVYVVSPEGGPEWQLRGNITILLPRRR
jgi:hypothetical protein